MIAIVTTSLDAARAARTKLDAALGFPALSGGASGGVTTTTCQIVEAIDWPSVGVTSYLLPITPDYEAAATGLGYVPQDVDMGALGATTVFDATSTFRVGTALTVDQAKAAKFAAISAKTDALFDRGYEYPPGSGHRFSLHEDARALRTRLLVVMSTPAMTWPLVWPTLDYSAAVTLANTTDAANFVVAESLAVRAIQEGDAAIKAQLVAATTVAEVDAIVDGR